jgi:hypothetical protein
LKTNLEQLEGQEEPLQAQITALRQLVADSKKVQQVKMELKAISQ